MGTRSNIMVETKEGKIAVIYCHWDGYISHNGVILQEHYNSYEKAMKLIKLGDLSVLYPKCTKPAGHSFDNQVDGYTVAYGRDRGEKDCAAHYYNSITEAFSDKTSWSEYAYLFKNGAWYVAVLGQESQAFIPLFNAIEHERNSNV